MKSVISLLTFVCLAGCAQSGYSPSYIISDATKEMPPPAEEAEEL